jgi:hypothetical protein
MMCVLLVCLCVPDPVHLAWRGSARQSCDIIHHFHLIYNLPSGYATWLNFSLLIFVQGSRMDQNGLGVHHIQDQMNMIL